MSNWLIDKAGVQIRLSSRSQAATDLLANILTSIGKETVAQSIAEPTKNEPVIKLSVDHQEGGWHLCDHSNDQVRTLNNTGDLIYHLTDRIVFHIADKARNAHCLHAASVAMGNNALVIPANSGDGKSSFTTWLLANGFSYITDELILVNAEQQVEGIARPIQIKSHGINAVKHLFTEPSLVHAGNFANAVPVQALAAKISEHRLHALRLFVFPQYREGADYSLVKLSSAEAGMRLMANHVNARNLEGHGFRQMMAIMRSTPCYALEYGGFNTLPDDFADTLATLLTQGVD